MTVINEAQCASACLFVLAGGLTRHVSGRLGIHRPFLDTPSRIMTAEDVKKAATNTQEQLRAYFREMNVSERLADDMMVIPSDQIRWLTPQEIVFYGLGIDDLVIKETKILKAAQKYGLSRIEAEGKWRRVQELCTTSPDTFGAPPDCMDKIMRGVQP